MDKPRARDRIAAILSSFLWLIILVPILGVSGWSFYWVARHIGSPWYVAAVFSTAFDGVVLLSANKSLDFVQDGISDFWPRWAVRSFVCLGAFVQAFHARLDHEAPGAWVIWAALPLGAAVAYELHIHKARVKAKARVGAKYPAPLPSLDIIWSLLHPFQAVYGRTVKDKETGERKQVERGLMDILHARNRAVVETNLDYVIPDQVAKWQKQYGHPQPVKRQPARAAITIRPEEAPEPPVSQGQVIRIDKKRGHKKHIREWARENGWPDLGDRARLPKEAETAYYAAHPYSATK